MITCTAAHADAPRARRQPTLAPVAACPQVCTGVRRNLPREQSNRMRHNSMNVGEAPRRCACARVKFTRSTLHRTRTGAALAPARLAHHPAVRHQARRGTWSKPEHTWPRARCAVACDRADARAPGAAALSQDRGRRARPRRRDACYQCYRERARVRGKQYRFPHSVLPRPMHDAHRFRLFLGRRRAQSLGGDTQGRSHRRLGPRARAPPQRQDPARRLPPLPSPRGNPHELGAAAATLGAPRAAA